MILEPFYLIQEQAAKVWIERVVMILELNPSHKLSIDPNNAKHRSVLFEILVADSETEALPAKVQAAMNQTLGIPAISSVHLRRSFLLF
jgi:cell division septal protein FtsQ